MLHVPHYDAYPHPPPMSYPVGSAALGLAMNAPDLPEITVTAQDVRRLARLVDDLFHIRDGRVAFLARELDRAAIVDSAEIPAGVVTMRSLVEFRSGEEFDASWNRGESIEFPLRGLIQGWQEGIPGMRVGGRRQLTIPPEKAYGPAGAGHRLSGKTLVFVIDLLGVR